ncbi:hypothetical protein GOBAR_AA25662 [Gossypium barbadense]|uniref:Acyltransferase n=1 Tax=Gossypium barbadense TaxID=3634 RepID=A0A2P5WVD6_GOSBA|nr:hypothetical protein GOBAR_AA25662 [Gossypium barbadense]
MVGCGVESGGDCVRSWRTMVEEREEKKTYAAGSGYRQFNGRNEFSSNVLHGILACAMWIGALHFDFYLIVFSLLFLPFSKFLLVVGLLLVFAVVPIDHNSKFGLRLARLTDSNMIGMSRFHASSQTEMPYHQPCILHSILEAYMDMVGASPATRKNFCSLLEAGYSCIVVPGGVQETFLMQHDSEVAFLKSRRGFVRIAMEMGCPLVPVFAFGQLQMQKSEANFLAVFLLVLQSHAYKWWKPGGKLILQLSRAIKFVPMLFWGAFGTPIPYQHPMHVVVGKPIYLKKNPQPTAEEVLEVHDQFVKALEDLFERHKARVGYDDLHLKII